MPTYFLKFSQLHPNQSPSHSNEEHFHIPDKKIVYPYTAERRDVLGNISPGSRRTNKRFPKGQGGCISIYVHVQCTVYTERPFSVSLIFLLATDGVKYEVCTPPARTGGSVYPSRLCHLQISTWQMWKNFRFLHICHECCDKYKVCTSPDRSKRVPLPGDTICRRSFSFSQNWGQLLQPRTEDWNFLYKKN